MPSFGERSLVQLETCHPSLILLFTEVIKYWDCTIIEGKRTLEQQQLDLLTGASKTLNSKHITVNGVSMAVDVSPYPIKWTDYNRFYAFAGFVIGTAVQLGIKVRWGGDWDGDRDFSDQKFNDLVHFELL